jgi:hypothetical protein
MVRLLSCFLLILTLTVFSGPVMAQTAEGIAAPVAAIGTLLEVEGEGNLIMRAAEEGKAYPAKIDDAVYQDDLIQSGPGAKILVMLIDDSRVTLSENSQLKIDEYVYDDTSDVSNKARYNVLRGAFLYTSGLIAKKPNPDVKINTAYGAIGIRGTTVWGGTIDDQYSVFVDDGEVSFETDRGRIRVMAGEGTTIRSRNSIPERARIWGPDKISAAKAKITLKDTAKIKERMAAYKQKQPEFIAKHKDAMRAKRQDRIEQQNPRDSIKRLDNKSRNIAPEKKTEKTPLPGANNPAREAVKKQIMENREERKDMIEEKMEQRKAPQKAEIKRPVEQGKNVTPPAFPRPEPIIRPNQENLPSDPAKRQEELEKRNLKDRGPAAVKRHDPL